MAIISCRFFTDHFTLVITIIMAMAMAIATVAATVRAIRNGRLYQQNQQWIMRETQRGN